MRDTDAPTKVVLPWAAGAIPPYITAGGVPVPSQQAVKNGAASFTDGFPALCFVPYATGGAGPYGADFNAVLNQITAGLRWLQTGGPVYWDGTFAAAIGGYPAGALVASNSSLALYFLNGVDGNTSNPDTGGANWTAVYLASSLPNSVGFARLATGPILQWGVANIQLAAGYGSTTVTFPVAFPTACLQAVASDNGFFLGVVTGAVTYACGNLQRGNFSLAGAMPASQSSTGIVGGRWMAIGY